MQSASGRGRSQRGRQAREGVGAVPWGLRPNFFNSGWVGHGSDHVLHSQSWVWGLSVLISACTLQSPGRLLKAS